MVATGEGGHLFATSATIPQPVAALLEFYAVPKNFFAVPDIWPYLEVR